MPPPHRIELPRSLQKALIAECNGKCSVPTCSHMQHLEFHHIDGNPSANGAANLIVLCPNHHADADRGVLSTSECSQYKQYLTALRPIMPAMVSFFTSQLAALRNGENVSVPEPARAQSPAHPTADQSVSAQRAHKLRRPGSSGASEKRKATTASAGQPRIEFAPNISSLTLDSAGWSTLTDMLGSDSVATHCMIHLLKPWSKSVVIEAGYRDSDFIASLTALYASQHFEISRACTRLHFFGCLVDRDALMTMHESVSVSRICCPSSIAGISAWCQLLECSTCRDTESFG